MATEHRHGNCKEIFEQLSAYLDLDLPPEACRDIEEHLAGCPPCIEFTESLRKTVELCRGYEPSEVPGPVGEAARRELLEAYRRMLERKQAR